MLFRSPVLFQDHRLVIDAEVKRPDMLKCSSCDQLGAFLDAIDIVNCEMTAKERQGDVTKLAGRLGTST